MELKLTKLQFNELCTKGIPLDLVFLLSLIQNEGGTEIWEECVKDPNYHPKWENLFLTLNRKGLISGTKITDEGEEILKFISSKEEKPKIARKKKEIKKEIEDDFLSFWKEFPGTDSFTYKGKTFKGTRALKAKKPECKVKLNAIIAEGEYTLGEIISALKLEISQKKENSIKTGQNKLQYMNNSLTWLNQRGFESFIELVRAGHKPEEDTKTQLTNETFI